MIADLFERWRRRRRYLDAQRRIDETEPTMLDRLVAEGLDMPVEEVAWRLQHGHDHRREIGFHRREPWKTPYPHFTPRRQRWNR